MEDFSSCQVVRFFSYSILFRHLKQVIFYTQCVRSHFSIYCGLNPAKLVAMGHGREGMKQSPTQQKSWTISYLVMGVTVVDGRSCL